MTRIHRLLGEQELLLPSSLEERHWRLVEAGTEAC